MNIFSVKKQSGVSLVELMISLVIATVILLAVTSIYVTSKRGYAIQDSMARQQENGRFAVELLTQNLRMAGFMKDNRHDPFIAATTADGGGNVSDTITIQFESQTDCLGQATPANSCDGQQCAINNYFIDANNNLSCLGNGGPNPDVIIEQVDNLQIQYGVDTDASPDGTANKYATWNNVTVDEREKIVSVRFAVLVSTPTQTAKAALTTTHNVLDQTLNVTDRRINRVYTSTVVLRNRL